MVRSKVQYLNRLKNQQFLLSIIKNNYQTKTIKRIQLNNGTIIHYQETILQTVANYYAYIFDRKTVDEIDFLFIWGFTSLSTLYTSFHYG